MRVCTVQLQLCIIYVYYVRIMVYTEHIIYTSSWRNAYNQTRAHACGCSSGSRSSVVGQQVAVSVWPSWSLWTANDPGAHGHVCVGGGGGP